MQLLGRSGDLFKCLLTHGGLTKAQLDLIWEATKGKHESVVSAIHELMVCIAEHCDLPSAATLFQHMEQVPLKSFDTPLLNLVAKYEYPTHTTTALITTTTTTTTTIII
jgi:hypothetical protein